MFFTMLRFFAMLSEGKATRRKAYMSDERESASRTIGQSAPK